MLVLSRRETEKILFPEAGIAVELLQIKGNRARIGVKAPNSMTILRGELAKRSDELTTAVETSSQLLADDNDSLRTALKSAASGLLHFRQQLEQGQVLEAEETYQQVLETLSSPAAVREVAGRMATTALTVENTKKTTTAAERTALLVEDDPNEAELLAGFLRLSGFDVSTAEDGEHALNHLSRNDRPDCVLVDMIMPRCDGATTVNAIRRNRAYDGMKVFAVSGTSPSAFGLESGATGVDRWFQKPVNPEVLVDHLTRELAGCPSAA